MKSPWRANRFSGGPGNSPGRGTSGFAVWGEGPARKTLDEPNSASVTLPKELLPAGTLYVRFTATAPCQLTYYTYKVSLEHKETPKKRLSGARGETEFVE